MIEFHSHPRGPKVTLVHPLIDCQQLTLGSEGLKCSMNSRKVFMEEVTWDVHLSRRTLKREYVFDP